jgi:DNA-binding transcriptional regulator YiaG
MDLKKRVEQTGIKKSKLARMLGVQNSQLTDWLKGTRTMPEKTEKHLRDILYKLEEALRE